MGKRVLVVARDLFFRSKLGGEDVEARITAMVEQGIPVLAFGSHVKPEALRAARALGATAVPNSELEKALREFF